MGPYVSPGTALGGRPDGSSTFVWAGFSIQEAALQSPAHPSPRNLPCTQQQPGGSRVSGTSLQREAGQGRGQRQNRFDGSKQRKETGTGRASSGTQPAVRMSRVPRPGPLRPAHGPHSAPKTAVSESQQGTTGRRPSRGPSGSTSQELGWSVYSAGRMFWVSLVAKRQATFLSDTQFVRSNKLVFTGG